VAQVNGELATSFRVTLYQTGENELFLGTSLIAKPSSSCLAQWLAEGLLRNSCLHLGRILRTKR
jgi:hypothetical protein